MKYRKPTETRVAMSDDGMYYGERDFGYLSFSVTKEYMFKTSARIALAIYKIKMKLKSKHCNLKASFKVKLC